MAVEESSGLPIFTTEDDAWAGAAERNKALRRDRGWKLSEYWTPVRYWIAVELPSGDWTVAESTGPDQTRRQRVRGVLGELFNPFNGSWGP